MHDDHLRRRDPSALPRARATARTIPSSVLVPAALVVLASACSFERVPVPAKVTDEPNAGSSGRGDAGLDGGGAGTSAGTSGAPMAGQSGSAGNTGNAGEPSSGSGGSTGDPDAGLDHDGSVEEAPPVFGLSCDGVTCPGLPAGNDQCCTDTADVETRRARQSDRCGVLAAAGGGCVELEQPGVDDDSCPAMDDEPGCCTTEGRCGSFDSELGIGCHENASVEQVCGDEIEEDVECTATGIFAVRASIDVTWGGRDGALFDLTDDGRGTIELDLLVSIEEIGKDERFTARSRACAARLPPFYSTVLCEAYQPVFPDTIWESDAAPTFELTGEYQCRNPGCFVTFDPVTSLVGIELDDADGAFPSASQAASFSCASGEGVECYPDHDDDGRPGIGIVLESEGEAPDKPDCRSYPHEAAPLNQNPFAIVGGVRRTDRLQLGVRMRVGIAGTLAEDCSGAEGGGIAEFLQSRAAGCLAEPGSANPFGMRAGANDPCTSNERLFVNQSLPDYDALRLGEQPNDALELDDVTPSRGPHYRLARLADLGEEVDCADARAALAP